MQPPRPYTIAAIQLQPGTDRRETLSATEHFLRDAADRGADLVLLPEVFAAPFVGAAVDFDYFEWAEPADGPSNQLVQTVSAETGMTIVSSIFEETSTPAVYHNSAFTYVAGELDSIYRKSHLPFSNGFPEKFYFQPGAEPPPVVRTDRVTVGSIICYERHFPELSRVVALAGGEILCVPVACASAPTREVFQLELRAHATFNRMFVVCANRVGAEGDKSYYGMSAIYGTDGRIIAQAQGAAGGEVVVAEVDLVEVVQSRLKLPIFRDRRPDLYTSLIDAE